MARHGGEMVTFPSPSCPCGSCKVVSFAGHCECHAEGLTVGTHALENTGFGVWDGLVFLCPRIHIYLLRYGDRRLFM